MPHDPLGLSFLTREPNNEFNECENTASFQITPSTLPGIVDYFILVVTEVGTTNSNEFKVNVTTPTVTATFPKDNVVYDVDAYAVAGCNAHRRQSNRINLADNPTYVPGRVYDKKCKTNKQNQKNIVCLSNVGKDMGELINFSVLYFVALKHDFR